ncbi:penicillin-binding protein 2 [Porticoccaceae bacterium LTM1]|nr:penicillin-binding protein 2 [Porticoccaceae bacterium LTM1]
MPVERHLKDPVREQRLYITRALVAAVVVLMIIGLLVWRYYHLQVTRHQDFVAASDKNRIHVRAVPPTRGLIYDRNGMLLADNRPSFTLRVIKEQAGDMDALLTKLRELVPISDDEVDDYQKRLRFRLPYEAIPLRYNLSEKEQGMLAVNSHFLPGVEVAAELVRHYPAGDAMTHVVGYVGRISESDLQKFSEEDDSAYKGTHVIGKRGLESSYEDLMLGTVGSENVETNSIGRVMRVLERNDPVQGSNLSLYLDARLQQLAFDALEGERGSVVAIDTRTGGVLAMVSAPSYDANLFVTGMTQSDVDALNDPFGRPQLNRSVQSVFPPASTVKPMYGLAFLESGKVTENTKVYDPGFFLLPNSERRNHCWERRGHGPMDLKGAIQQSCDTYYYKLSYDIGIDHMSRYGEMFGLGQATGIDLKGEKTGILPSREWKQIYKGRDWYPGDTINVSIGQGATEMTPLQMAVMTMRLANRGKAYQPKLVKAINGVELPLGEPKTYVEATPRHWDAVQDAMVSVVHSLRGTAHSISKGLTYKMAGKTGTAQVVGIPEGSEYDPELIAKSHRDHAMFIGYAPADDPQIAVAVVIQNGEKSSRSAKVARKVMDAWINGFPEPESENDAVEAN